MKREITIFDASQKERYMQRALELAANGRAYASPNPMVGAVIVAPDGRVIGEGWHRRCGEGHAEVNAVASVAACDRGLLRSSTMFVTLEPCSHYGKTPPCARMIVEIGIPRVIVAMTDPNPKVSGRGIKILQEAGITTEIGVLEEQARCLNRKFITAMTLRRPYITLKWARSADGFMDWRRDEAHRRACRFSTPLTTITTMRLRALNDGVLTTAATICADNPRLSVRGFDGRQPVPVILAGKTPLAADAALLAADAAKRPIIYSTTDDTNLKDIFADLYATHNITSVLVEAGPTLLAKLISDDFWDEAREEVAPFNLGADGVKQAPTLPMCTLIKEYPVETDGRAPNIIRWYSNFRNKL